MILVINNNITIIIAIVTYFCLKGGNAAISGAAKAINDAVDIGAVAATGVIADWAFGDYLKAAFTTTEDVLEGKETPSTAVDNASATASDIGSTVETTVSDAVDDGDAGGGMNVAEVTEDVGEVAEDALI